MEHDASSKLLFSHARMVEDLLHGFVHEAWVREVDWSTLERVSDSQSSDDLRRQLVRCGRDRPRSAMLFS